MVNVPPPPHRVATERFLNVASSTAILLSPTKSVEDTLNEDTYLDSYWENRYELAQYEEPPYDWDTRPEPEDWDDENGFPYNVRDLSDDGDALASAGWGTDGDYGGE